jgi:hypothetical protein
MFWLKKPEGRSAMRPKHKLTVQRNGQPTKKREYHVVSRMGDNHDLGVFNNNVDGVERALLERYFLCKVGDEFLPALDVPASVYASPELQRFKSECVSYVAARATVIALRTVVECYTGAKRRVYERALTSLLRKSLTRKDAELRPFTKFEKQCLLKALRLINPRSARFNLVLGRYLKKSEKLYFEAINEVWGAKTDHTVIKGMDSFASAAVLKQKWDRFRNPVALGLDATKFDMHVSVSALRYEHEFYNEVFQSDELSTLLSWQLHNKGVAYCNDGTVRFEMPGTRSSGDLNTSLGNCIIMCSLIWAMCKQLDIVSELANNGDDCVLMLEQEDLERVLKYVPEYFERVGFRMTVEAPVWTFEEIEFCQSHPVLLKMVGAWCGMYAHA